MLSEQKKKKNDDDIATSSAVSRAASKKYLDGTGLGHLLSLIISFVRNYAAAKTHNHDGVYAKSSHTHSADNITSGTIPIGRGGTGATSAATAANSLINACGEGTAIPSDNEWYLSSYADGVGKNNTPIRRKYSALWQYIKSKTDPLYAARTHNHDSAYAAKLHNHDAGNIVSGVLPIGRGGTGSGNRTGALYNMVTGETVGTSTDWNSITRGYHMVAQGTDFTADKHAPVGMYTYGHMLSMDNFQIYVAHNGGIAHRQFWNNAWTKWITSFDEKSVIPIVNGGTGATTAKQAQVNLLKNDMPVASTLPYEDSCFAFAEQPGNENATNGVLYRRRVKDVWTYFNNKIKSLYLPLTGGTVTGLLKTPGGTMVHNAGGTSGKVGYINIAEFNLAGTTYQNMPIQLDVFRRRMSMVTRLYIWFDPVDTSDPTIAHLGYEGAGTDTDFYMYKSATSTWQLYIKKAEAYDSIGIADYKTNFSYMRHKITFKDVQVSSVPSGAIAGKYCDAMRATAIKDAGDGRTLKINYSADALTNAEWFAVWNGGTLQSMNKNTVRGVIGAAPSSHTHTIAQVTNLQSALDSKQPKGNYAAASHQHGANEITSGVLPVAFGGTGFNLNSSGYSGIPYVFKGQPQFANIGAANNTFLMNNAGTLSFTQISSSKISDLDSHIRSYLLNYVYKVGYVWISYTSTSPASIIGGTWVAITGRFPYFNAGTSVGGLSLIHI